MSRPIDTATPEPLDRVPADAPAAAGRPPSRRGLTVVREALAGTAQDLTSIPLGRAVVLLAVPMVLETTMESLFAICDVFFVSRLGVEAVATVGLTEAVMTLFFAVATGVATATTAVVARRIGERRPDEAASTTVQGIALGLAVALLVGLPGALAAPRVLRLMGGSPQLVATGSPFTAIVLGASGVVMLLFLINAAFRGAGDAATAMRTLWLANAVNLVLDPCLIFGLGPFPRLGVTGAAIATTIGRGVGVLYQLRRLFGARGRLRVRVRHLRLRPDVILRLARLSSGGVLQFLIATSSWIVLVRLVGGYGSAAVAGYTIAMRIVIFALLPAWGVANAAATLMGQNLGADRPARAERAVWTAGRYNTAFLLAVGATFVAGAGPLVRVFSADPAVVAYGSEALRIISYGFGFYALGMVVVQALNGAGDTFTPSLINVLCYWLFQIPLAYVLADVVGLAARGVFIAVPVAESLMTVLAVMAFRRGRWRTRTV